MTTRHGVRGNGCGGEVRRPRRKLSTATTTTTTTAANSKSPCGGRRTCAASSRSANAGSCGRRRAAVPERRQLRRSNSLLSSAMKLPMRENWDRNYSRRWSAAKNSGKCSQKSPPQRRRPSDEADEDGDVDVVPGNDVTVTYDV